LHYNEYIAVYEFVLFVKLSEKGFIITWRIAASVGRFRRSKLTTVTI
jgi:hypothetical protein